MIGRAIAQLLPPGFAVTSGSLLFEEEDLVRMAPARRRALLGRAIAFIPQAPMTALNPVQTIGAQFDEHLARLGQRSRKERRAHALAMLEAARLPHAGELLAQYPHQLIRRHVPARADRAGVFQQPAPCRRRRADDRARRHHAPADLAADRRHAAPARHCGRFHHPRPAPGRATVRRGDRDVCRPRGGKRPGARRAVDARASLYALPAARQSADERGTARALCHAGPDAELAAAAEHGRLPFRAAMSARGRGMPPQRAAECGDRRRPQCCVHPRKRHAEHTDNAANSRCAAGFRAERPAGRKTRETL